MWLLIFIFILMTLILIWVTFGYFIVLYFIGLLKKHPKPTFPAIWPKISVIISCYNEASMIADKINDMFSIEYPAESLEVILVDGGSTDGTPEIVENAIRDKANYKLIRFSTKGKINQLNQAMSVVNGEIIVNTDVDARLSKHSLKWIAAEFNVSSNVGVVGAYCRPAKTLEIEHYYWSTQNKSRFVEDSAGTSSIVIAPCYAFRRGLLDNFPDDVVADDVYVSFYANSLGYRVVYSRHALAIEIRTPRKYTDFIVHKYRKSNAFLRESLRFIYKLPEMSRLVKVIMATRISQQVILPWAILFWILLFGSLLTLKCYDVAALSVASIFASFIMTRFVFSRVKLPDIKHRYSLRILIRGYLITTLIMLITGISYPFFKQGSCYNKIGRQVE